MKRLIEATRFLMAAATVVLLVVAVFTLLWGGAKAVKVVLLVATTRGQDPHITLQLIQVVDAFLIAVVLYLFAVSIFELFVGGLSLPNWMVAHNLVELKTKLGGVIVLVMAVRFLEYILESPPSIELLYLGISIALVASVLIAFSHFGGKE